VDDHAVGDYILNSRGLQSNFRNLSGKSLTGISIDREGHLNVVVDLADVGFVNTCLHLHPRKIIRDQK